jgi:N-acetylglutamate synthase-like GNAT family acetyltransferase
MDRLDLVGCDMELTMEPAALAVATSASATRAVGWDDVIAEITRSCGSRAAAGALCQEPGVVGVLSGAAPVVWVHGEADVAQLLATVAGADAVRETYVSITQPGAVAALEATGWTRGEVMDQLVCAALPMGELAADLPAFRLLGPVDLPDMRGLLRECGETDEDFLAASYGNDFFTVAAPVWVLGAHDSDGRLIAMVAVRRQGDAALGFALSVAQDWRERGLGRAAVEVGLAQGFAAGARYVHAQAEGSGRQLLLSCGFERVGAWQRMAR